MRLEVLQLASSAKDQQLWTAWILSCAVHLRLHCPLMAWAFWM